MRADWDIFCNVFDNYGDIGVAWRLARTLVRDTAGRVRLWVDDLAAFRRIWPAVDASASEQCLEGVTIQAWRMPFEPVQPARVVIEAFGCALPESYLVAMAEQSPVPVWLNLEYLSAESWVAAHHGLPSPHPRLPMTKYFFFPGYTDGTGGLLRESDYAVRRAAFDAGAYWRALGLPARQDGELRVSLFAYENHALPGLLDAWANDTLRVTCLVPEGRVLPQVAAWLGADDLSVGERHVRGNLQLVLLSFTDQDAYDRLLWACDLNFVRGEDSCVRAQWAAHPLVWQAYPQAEGVHLDKLEALLALYLRDAPDEVSAAVSGLWRCWNGVPDAPDAGAAWASWRRGWAGIARHAEAWPAWLARVGRLTDKLAEFAENQLK
ncbi:MAG: elongation factor P maturation arginine rhamnosyltransferase EarP [Pseudomonadota bacterium]